MELNIKHTDSFGTGAFILNENRIPYFPFQEGKCIFLTQENNKSLKEEILRLINESKEVLKICTFIITDKEVFEAILNKAQNSNIAIFLLTQLDQNKLSNSVTLLDYLTEEEISGNSSQIHLKYLKRLFDNGVHVRASVSAHAKFIVSDRKIGFVTSANLTTPSLSFNTESGICLDKNDTKELDKLFDAIFQKGTSYRQFLSSSKKSKIFVVQSEIKVEKRFLPIPKDSNLRYTYEYETNNLYDEIISIIDNAKEYLYISTYSIVGLESIKEFTQAISVANRRGISINLFCRGMNYRNDHLTGSDKLHSLGCKIFADMFNHSKGIINEKTGLIFTANIDGNHGLKSGFEIGYILKEEQRIEFLKIHQHLIETSFYRYNTKPSRIELFQTYINYEMLKGIRPPTFPKDLVLLIKKDLNVSGKEIKEQPIFYGKSKDSEYIIVGNSYYKCQSNNNKFILLEKENPRFDLERYILKYFNLKIMFS